MMPHSRHPFLEGASTLMMLDSSSVLIPSEETCGQPLEPVLMLDCVMDPVDTYTSNR